MFIIFRKELLLMFKYFKKGFSSNINIKYYKNLKVINMLLSLIIKLN
jgi:hypothetical protein